MSGEFLGHVRETLRLLGDVGLSKDCGFTNFLYAGDAMLAEGALQEDERIAETFGRFARLLAANRLRRTFYAFHGWPHRCLRILLGEREQEEVIRQFREDFVAWEALKEVEPRQPALQQIIDRSTCSLPKTQQWVCAFQSTGWQVTPDVLGLAAEKARAVSSSLPCEEMIHYMKNCKRAKAGRRLCRPQKCMATVISQKVLHKRFHFEAFHVNRPLPRKMQKLEDGHFRPTPGDDSVDFTGSATRQQKAPYYSSTASGIGRLAADLYVLREMSDTRDFGKLDHFGLNLMCDAKHDFVWRAVNSETWCAGLFHFSGSVGIAWPVEVLPVPFCPAFEHVNFCLPRGEPTPAPLLEWGSILSSACSLALGGVALRASGWYIQGHRPCHSHVPQR